MGGEDCDEMCKEIVEPQKQPLADYDLARELQACLKICRNNFNENCQERCEKIVANQFSLHDTYF